MRKVWFYLPIRYLPVRILPQAQHNGGEWRKVVLSKIPQQPLFYRYSVFIILDN